jgi:hypothetical protein
VRTELVDQDVGHRLREGLEQREPVLLGQALQPLALEAAAGAASRACGCSGSNGSGGDDAPHGAGCDQGSGGKLAGGRGGGHHHHHGHAAGDASGAGLPAGGYGPDGLLAPLASEVAAAASEAARGLDAAIEAINEALAEIRDAAEELRGGG